MKKHFILDKKKAKYEVPEEFLKLQFDIFSLRITRESFDRYRFSWFTNYKKDPKPVHVHTSILNYPNTFIVLDQFFDIEQKLEKTQKMRKAETNLMKKAAERLLTTLDLCYDLSKMPCT